MLQNWMLNWVFLNIIEKVAIHYYGRLAAKQGWRFDSTYDHKDGSGEPVPFVFTLGSGKVSFFTILLLGNGYGTIARN